MRDKALCERGKLKAFISPDNAAPEELEAAGHMCKSCPLLQACARAALTAGDTTDRGVRRPADGVFQAGIICRGDYQTAARLAERAGCEVPAYLVEEAGRPSAPNRCRACGRAMVRWHRGVTPEGYVMHFARGFCSQCRGAYREWKREHPEAVRRVASIDRSRHSAPGRSGRVVDVQLSLF